MQKFADGEFAKFIRDLYLHEKLYKMPHSHDHGNCSHEAGDIDPLEMGIQYSLYNKIDFNNLEVLNEAEENSGKRVCMKRLFYDESSKS